MIYLRSVCKKRHWSKVISWQNIKTLGHTVLLQDHHTKVKCNVRNVMFTLTTKLQRTKWNILCLLWVRNITILYSVTFICYIEMLQHIVTFFNVTLDRSTRPWKVMLCLTLTKWKRNPLISNSFLFPATWQFFFIYIL